MNRREIIALVSGGATVIEAVRSGLCGTNWRGTSPPDLAFCLGGNQEASDGSGSH